MLEIIPNVIDLLISGVCNTADKIRDTAKRVKVNRYQCTRLSDRVDTIVGFLQSDKMNNQIPNNSLKIALEQFQKFLQRCLEFIKKFVKGGWLIRILRHQNYFHEFREFNEELSQHCQDLNFGLALILYRKFSAEDVQDAKNDLEEIAEITHTQQHLIPKKTPANLTVKLQTNIPATRYPTIPLQDQYRKRYTWHDYLQSPQYFFYSTNRIVRGHHRSFVPNYFY